MYSERERPSHFSVYRDAAFLSKCSDSEAHDWLKSRPISYSPVLGTPETPPESHILEYILYRRNLPQIDLFLAEHGRSGSVLARVYKRADASTRVVACGNPSLITGPPRWRSEALLLKIVKGGPLAELRALCENPHLTNDFYADLISSWEGDKKSSVAAEDRLPDYRFKQVLLFLSRNPRISTPRENSEQRHYLDGYSDYTYNKLFNKGWELAEIVPANPEWAEILERLYSRLHRPSKVFHAVEAVLNRWRLDTESRYSPMVGIRETIKAKFSEPSLENLNSDDPAVRQAFYSIFDPENAAFRDLDWAEWLERDPMCYLELNRNMNIWQSARGRTKLQALLWRKSRENHDITDVGFFDEQEEEYRETNPEWFRDENEQHVSEDKEPERDRIGELDRSIRELVSAFAKRSKADAVLFLIAALVGSFMGATIW